MRRRLPALLSALLFVPHMLAAQDVIEDPLLTRGARVRITYAGDDARVGTLISLAPDTIAVEWENGGTARMARTRVTRLDVSHGIRSGNKAERAKIGFAVGAGAGLVIGALSSKSDSQCASSIACEDLAHGFATVIGAAMLGGIGAAVGAISGRASERWEKTRLLPPHIGLVVPPRGHGRSLGLALVF